MAMSQEPRTWARGAWGVSASFQARHSERTPKQKVKASAAGHGRAEGCGAPNQAVAFGVCTDSHL